MAHWFHRNPLKATSPVGFELRSVLTSPDTGKICSELRLCRSRLLDLLRDPNNDPAAIDKDFELFLSLLRGFLFAHDEKSGDSKLRNLVRYKWTSSMIGYTPTELSDAWFEVVNMTCNVALWFMKHAAKTAGKDEVSENEAKEVHRCLRKAAGLFSFVQSERARINEQPDPGADLDPRVLTAYIDQCTAEAQEVTVARAIELKHTASLISALANETSKLFQQADEALAQLDPAKFEKWRKYLQLKAQFYFAYAYSYCGESLLGQDQCGAAIRALKESEQCVSKSEQLCVEYGKARGAGANAKPEAHLFFRQLKPVVKRTLEKCERENGFIYHQKVPDQPPELELKATYGLVKPDEFHIPDSCPAELGVSWTPAVYAAFDITKAPMPDFSKSKKSQDELPAVKEEPVYQTDKEPKNSSGCVVS